MIEVTLRVLQIDGEAEIRINPVKNRDPYYQRYHLSRKQLLNLAADAIQTYTEINNHAERKTKE